jgi:hypothetical protein
MSQQQQSNAASPVPPAGPEGEEDPSEYSGIFSKNPDLGVFPSPFETQCRERGFTVKELETMSQDLPCVDGVGDQVLKEQLLVELTGYPGYVPPDHQVTPDDRAFAVARALDAMAVSGVKFKERIIRGTPVQPNGSAKFEGVAGDFMTLESSERTTRTFLLRVIASVCGGTNVQGVGERLLAIIGIAIDGDNFRGGLAANLTRIVLFGQFLLTNAARDETTDVHPWILFWLRMEVHLQIEMTEPTEDNEVTKFRATVAAQAMEIEQLRADAIQHAMQLQSVQRQAPVQYPGPRSAGMEPTGGYERPSAAATSYGRGYADPEQQFLGRASGSTFAFNQDRSKRVRFESEYGGGPGHSTGAFGGSDRQPIQSGAPFTNIFLGPDGKTPKPVVIASQVPCHGGSNPGLVSRTAHSIAAGHDQSLLKLHQRMCDSDGHGAPAVKLAWVESEGEMILSSTTSVTGKKITTATELLSVLTTFGRAILQLCPDATVEWFQQFMPDMTDMLRAYAYDVQLVVLVAQRHIDAFLNVFRCTPGRPKFAFDNEIVAKARALWRSQPVQAAEPPKSKARSQPSTARAAGGNGGPPRPFTGDRAAVAALPCRNAVSRFPCAFIDCPYNHTTNPAVPRP